MPTRRSSTTEPDGRRTLWRSFRVRASLAVAPLLLAGARPGPARPTAAARDPLVYASNEKGNSVSVISARTNAVVATILVGKRPRCVALAPVHARSHVPLSEGTAMGVIYAAEATPTATFPADSDPE